MNKHPLILTRAQNQFDTEITATTSISLLSVWPPAPGIICQMGHDFLEAATWNTAYHVSVKKWPSCQERFNMSKTQPALDMIDFLSLWQDKTNSPPLLYIKTFPLICVVMFLSHFKATFDTRTYEKKKKEGNFFEKWAWYKSANEQPFKTINYVIYFCRYSGDYAKKNVGVPKTVHMTVSYILFSISNLFSAKYPVPSLKCSLFFNLNVYHVNFDSVF